MSVWLWVVVAFVAGGLVGAGVTALLKRGSDVEQRMRRLRREYEQYQAEVARHFSQTGELLVRLRTTFDQLYNEVQERATGLVGEEALQRRLDYLDNDAPAPGERAARPAPSQGRLGADRTATPGFGTRSVEDDGVPPSGPGPSTPAPADADVERRAGEAEDAAGDDEPDSADRR